MPAGIDFERLTLRGAFDFAILIEEDALLRYREIASRVRDPDAAAFFREMVANETRHRAELEARRRVLFRHEPPRQEVSVLGDLAEAPHPSEIGEAITPREAMEVALRAEMRAFEFYDQAVAHVTDPEVRAFFAEFRAEEVEHQRLITRRLAALQGQG